MHLDKVISRATVTVSPDASLVHAAQLMRDEHVGSVIAIDPDRRPIGILTDRDIVVSVIARDAQDLLRLSVGDVCTASPIAASEDEDVTTVVSRMRRHGIRRVPVVGRDGSLVGVFSLDDALGALAGDLADAVELIQAERVREKQRRT